MIKPLTSLRFIFALMVFLTHMNFLYPKGYASFNWLYDHVFYEGYIGVSFFFILSGFILTHTYKTKLISNTVSKREFWIRRLARIYPLHVATLLLAIPLLVIEVGNQSQLFTKQYLANIFMLQSFGPDRSYFFSGNALSWSISDEMFFYFCFPFLIFLLFHYKHLAKIILLGACIAIPFAMPHVAVGVPEHTIFYINPFVRLIDFSLGIFLYEVYLKLKDKNIKQYGTALEISSILLFSIFLYFHNSIPQADRYSCYYWIPIGLIILIFSFQSGKLSALLSHKAFVFLGEISFGFYMFHQLCIRYYTQLDLDFTLTKNPYIAALIVLTAGIAISAFGYFAIEKTMNKWIINKFASKRTK